MLTFLPSLQILVVVVIVAWNVLLSTRIAQVRTLPRPFAFLTALAGFLLLPALAIHVATSDAITARSVSAVEWIWPITLVLFALQALYAATRRLVNPFLGPLPFRHIARIDDDPGDAWITQKIFADAFQETPCAVTMPKTIFHRRLQVLLHQIAAKNRQHPLHIIRMHEIECVSIQ